jgi:hypothetical protein
MSGETGLTDPYFSGSRVLNQDFGTVVLLTALV